MTVLPFVAVSEAELTFLCRALDRERNALDAAAGMGGWLRSAELNEIGRGAFRARAAGVEEEIRGWLPFLVAACETMGAAEWGAAVLADPDESGSDSPRSIWARHGGKCSQMLLSRDGIAVRLVQLDDVRGSLLEMCSALGPSAQGVLWDLDGWRAYVPLADPDGEVFDRFSRLLAAEELPKNPIA